LTAPNELLIATSSPLINDIFYMGVGVHKLLMDTRYGESISETKRTQLAKFALKLLLVRR